MTESVIVYLDDLSRELSVLPPAARLHFALLCIEPVVNAAAHLTPSSLPDSPVQALLRSVSALRVSVPGAILSPDLASDIATVSTAEWSEDSAFPLRSSALLEAAEGVLAAIEVQRSGSSRASAQCAEHVLNYLDVAYDPGTSGFMAHPIIKQELSRQRHLLTLARNESVSPETARDYALKSFVGPSATGAGA